MTLPVDYFSIIHKYIAPDSSLYRVYLPHVSLVTAKALGVAKTLGLSQQQQTFIEEAAMLHDIGIVRVEKYNDTADALPYLCHAPAGREILEQEGLPRHALVAERHVGLGLSKHDIVRQALPLPQRDMLSETLEEKIICWADLFFSKHPERLWRERSLEEVERNVERYGSRQLSAFRKWTAAFISLD